MGSIPTQLKGILSLYHPLPVLGYLQLFSFIQGHFKAICSCLGAIPCIQGAVLNQWWPFWNIQGHSEANHSHSEPAGGLSEVSTVNLKHPQLSWSCRHSWKGKLSTPLNRLLPLDQGFTLCWSGIHLGFQEPNPSGQWALTVPGS